MMKPSQTHYFDTELLKLVVQAGDLYGQIQKLFAENKGVHSDHLWAGDLPIMYLEECIGYLRMEDEWVNFHEAEKEE